MEVSSACAELSGIHEHPAKLLERRIIINRTDETVLRFLPPFILQREHVDTTLAAMDEIFTELEAQADQPSPEAATAAISGGR